jgi:hypothetical protein
MRIIALAFLLYVFTGCDRSDNDVFRKVILLDGSVHYVTFSNKCFLLAWCSTLYEIGMDQPK